MFYENVFFGPGCFFYVAGGVQHPTNWSDFTCTTVSVTNSATITQSNPTASAFPNASACTHTDSAAVSTSGIAVDARGRTG
jgi:uncharacterized RmlC-like cupin family protein